MYVYTKIITIICIIKFHKLNLEKVMFPLDPQFMYTSKNMRANTHAKVYLHSIVLRWKSNN